MKSSKEILGIQLLRGVCAIAVVFDHASGMVSMPKYFGKTEPGLSFLKTGSVGVDIFFVISGFIISLVSLDDMCRPRLAWKDFALKRFARIVPLMWVAIASYAILRFLGRGGHDLMPIFRAFVLWPSGDVDPDTIWTLRHEAIFYFVFATTFLINNRIKYLLPIWAFSPILYSCYTGNFTLEYPGQSYLEIIFSPVNIEFFAGFLVGIFWIKGFLHLDLKILSKFPLTSIILMFFASMLILSYSPFQWKSIAFCYFSSFFCSIILIICINLKVSDGFFSNLGILFGNSSYAIYLFHLHLLSASLGIWSKFSKFSSVYVVVFGVVFVSIILSILIHMFIEKPLVYFVNSYINSNFKNRQTKK